MAKIPFQDVVPPNKRSIRNVSIDSARRGHVKAPSARTVEEPQIIKLNKDLDREVAHTTPVEHESSVPRFSEGVNHYTQNPNLSREPIAQSPINQTRNQNYYFEEDGKKKPSRKIIFFGAIGVVILAFIAFIMTVLSSATVTITPKRASIETNLDLKTSNDGSSGIKYELVKLTKSKSVSVAAKGEDMVEKKSSGKIVVYNNFSEEPQRLISRTRFEAPGGLIYRIPESITIPGKTTKDGKSVPGSIEVEVFADEAGDKYNIDKADFTIPGFKTDKTRYTSLYAKSSTEMSGGFIGKMKTVVEADKIAAMTKLESELKTEGEKEITTQIPEGLVLINGATVYTKKELPQKDDGSSVSLTLEVTSYSMLLPKDTLSKQIIDGTVANDTAWEGIEAMVSDFSSLSLSMKDSPANAGTIDVKLSGTATIEAKINNEAVIESLTNTKQKDLSEVLHGFPGIIEAQAAIRPIWKKTFPENPAKIYISIK